MLDASNVGVVHGGLTADPEIINNKIVKMRLGVDYAGREKDSDNRSGYFDVVYYLDESTPNGKFVASQLRDNKMKKGSGLAIVYGLEQERWTAQDGTKRSNVVLVAQSISYRKGSGGGERGSESQSGASPQSSQPRVSAPNEF